MTNKYQRCTYCGWKGDIGAENLAECPKCQGFLILKSTRHKSSPTYRKTKSRGPDKDELGYRLKKSDGGWVFVEGKKESASQILRNGDVEKINACARRRGIIKSSNTYMKPEYTWT